MEPTNQRVTSHRLGMCFVCHLCGGQDAVRLCCFVWVCMSSHPEMQCSTRGSSAFPYESVRQSLQWRHQAVHHTVHTAFGNTAINIMYTQDCLRKYRFMLKTLIFTPVVHHFFMCSLPWTLL